MTEAYPLQWPIGRERTPAQKRERARFKTSFAAAREGLFHELSLMGARYLVVSTNVKLKRDGLPYAPGSLSPVERDAVKDDPGVAVYYEQDGVQYAFSCDRWDRVEDNLQAIRKTVEALRGLDRWGTGDAVRAAFSGFRALPEPGEEPWWQVLGFMSPREVSSRQIVESAYRDKAFLAHPDRGGSNEAMRRLNKARDEGLREIKL